MEKNTLKGKVKVLSYIVAFIFMVGINMSMDKIVPTDIGSGSHQVIEKHSPAKGYLLKVGYLSSDSLSILIDNKKKDACLRMNMINNSN
ncbi:hypothetical protein JGH11_02465 [Dysgonomonas sp. Marseille-P4677]|uniref:hypothetical protein n=1 Tax=Dysgonomonas sp. Marseille-P4677 TaxID=2364790 RepID=UPI00191332A3|nr:hypothetical protein [Dysgonomonas sp. Marseille-P4677]MBK5719730.1 hypothetical protein [Dysgonomonas sp. Marseille-P4677]